MHLTLVFALLTGCWGENAYIVKGTVVEVNGSHEVVIDHEAIPGLMGPMVMPFEVRDDALIAGLEPGDQVLARFVIAEDGGHLTRVRVTGHVPPPEPRDEGPAPLRPGEALPELELPLHDGTALVLGPEQRGRVALTFLYTTCPIPEYCPAVVARLQALQEVLPEGARIVAVTLDPEHDTREVLEQFASTSTAGERWHFARLDEAGLAALAQYAALQVTREEGKVLHGLRLLVLGQGGKLIERYDDNRWPLDRVVSQLATGAPSAPAGTHGTLTPEPDEG